MKTKLLSLGLITFIATSVAVASSVHAQKQVTPATATGCADWPSNKFIQTPFGPTANGGTGWSKAGPSYYGEGWHVGCNDQNGGAGYIHQYYALDFPLKQGDPISAPAPGKVIWAGWTSGGWSNLGRIVVVDLGGGYWSMSAHLSQIKVSVGQRVSGNTVIGLVGGSGNHQENYWGPHLHQAIFLNAHLDTAHGGIYGGQSVQMHNVKYFGHGGGVYPSFQKYQSVSW